MRPLGRSRIGLARPGDSTVRQYRSLRRHNQPPPAPSIASAPTNISPSSGHATFGLFLFLLLAHNIPLTQSDRLLENNRVYDHVLTTTLLSLWAVGWFWRPLRSSIVLTAPHLVISFKRHPQAFQTASKLFSPLDLRLYSRRISSLK